MNDILTWVMNNKETVGGFIIALYELIVRIKPTAKDWSILSFMMSFTNYLIPNKKTDGTTH